MVCPCGISLWYVSNDQLQSDSFCIHLWDPALSESPDLLGLGLGTDHRDFEHRYKGPREPRDWQQRSSLDSCKHEDPEQRETSLALYVSLMENIQTYSILLILGTTCHVFSTAWLPSGCVYIYI